MRQSAALVQVAMMAAAGDDDFDLISVVSFSSSLFASSSRRVVRRGGHLFRGRDDDPMHGSDHERPVSESWTSGRAANTGE